MARVEEKVKGRRLRDTLERKEEGEETDIKQRVGQEHGEAGEARGK